MSELQRLWESRLEELRSGSEDRSTGPNFLDSATRKGASIYELSERIIARESSYTKAALEELWAFENGIDGKNEKCAENVEQLIEHYQDKMDRLRDKEETLIRISRESVKMIEDRQQKGEELLRIRKELADTENEVAVLQRKCEKLASRKQELESFESEYESKLGGNQEQLVDGLFEIALLRRPATEASTGAAVKPQSPTEDPVSRSQPESLAVRDLGIPSLEIAVEPDNRPFFEKVEKPSVTYPKSIVKTSTGKVIGEYFYDPVVDKTKRNYVYNGRYFAEQLDLGIATFLSSREESLLQTLVQMTADGLSRTAKSGNIHFEISTNEILNSKSMTEVLSALRTHNVEGVCQFVRRYKAKLEALGANYEAMLAEQVRRLAEGQ